MPSRRPRLRTETLTSLDTDELLLAVGGEYTNFCGPVFTSRDC